MSLISRSTVSPTIGKFADSVEVKHDYMKNLNSKESFATWYQGVSVKIEAGRIDKVYTFGVKKTGYRVEAAMMWYPQMKFPC